MEEQIDRFEQIQSLKTEHDYVDAVVVEILCAIIAKQGTSEGEAPLICRAYDIASCLWRERRKREDRLNERLEKVDAATQR